MADRAIGDIEDNENVEETDLGLADVGEPESAGEGAQLGDGDSAAGDSTLLEGDGSETGDGEPLEAEDSEAVADEAAREAEKRAKVRQIKLISLVSAATVFVLAVGAVVFFLVSSHFNSFALTYEREIDGSTQTHRIGIDDFRFMVMHHTGQSFNPIAETLEYITGAVAILRMADELGLSLPEEEARMIRAEAEEFRDGLREDFPALRNLTAEFFEMVFSLNSLINQWYDHVFDTFVINEADYARELEHFIAYSRYEYIDAVYIYLTASSAERAAEAKAAIESGAMSVEEALIEFYYREALGEEFLAMHGFETVEEFVAEFGFGRVSLHELTLELDLSHEQVEHLAGLSVDGISDIIESGGRHEIFILESISIPTHEEIGEMFRGIYIDRRVEEMFEEEFERFYAEAEARIRINHRAIDSMNMDELFMF